MTQPKVLIVEDEAALREALCDTLSMAGFGVVSAGDGERALRILDQEEVRIVVSDVQMQPMNGHQLLKRIRRTHPALPVVLMTAFGSIQKAVEAMREGATDYLVKPFDATVLIEMVSRFMSASESVDTDLVAADVRTLELAGLARRVSETDTTVMITGESGTGKEVFASFIHRHSRRNNGPFLAINCAAIPENMLEAILFGYEKGAFTGAYESRSGKFELAGGGTLLLDEISEMELGLQAKLLRVLQEREVERLGGRQIIPLDVRVLATSNRDLRSQVEKGRFREDLYYRLNVFPLHVPPLRDRKDDILPLAQRFIGRHMAPQEPTEISKEAQYRMLNHDWPGNVRELDNVIQRAMILKSARCIEVENIYFESYGRMNTSELQDSTYHDIKLGSLGSDLKSREQELIIDALTTGKGSRKEAAALLGISPRTLRYKLARLREQGVAIPG